MSWQGAPVAPNRPGSPCSPPRFSEPSRPARRLHPVPTMWRSAVRLVVRTVDGYSTDRGEILAAGLSFYALLSIAPLALIAVAVAGSVLGTEHARAEVSALFTQSMGPVAAKAADGWIDEAAKSGGVASVVGLVLSLLGASRLVEGLRGALNQIYNVNEDSSEGFRASVTHYLRRRVGGLALVLAAGIVVLLAFVARALSSFAQSSVSSRIPVVGPVWSVVEIAVSFAVVAAVAAVLYRILPDAKLRWREAAWGGVVMSALFSVGNIAVGMYLGRASVTAMYGAAGSLVAVLLWFFFSAQFFLVGAEFSQALAEKRGTAVRGSSPQAGPVALPRPSRAET